MGTLGKLAASVLGDLEFVAPRRWLATYAARQAPVYGYQWTEKLRDNSLGVRHGSDLPSWLDASGKMGAVMSSALLNFANTLNPNGAGGKLCISTHSIR
jgi:carboxylesterase type B